MVPYAYNDSWRLDPFLDLLTPLLPSRLHTASLSAIVSVRLDAPRQTRVFVAKAAQRLRYHLSLTSPLSPQCVAQQGNQRRPQC
jgi:hypothetical protein